MGSFPTRQQIDEIRNLGVERCAPCTHAVISARRIHHGNTVLSVNEPVRLQISDASSDYDFPSDTSSDFDASSDYDFHCTTNAHLRRPYHPSGASSILLCRACVGWSQVFNFRFKSSSMETSSRHIVTLLPRGALKSGHPAHTG